MMGARRFIAVSLCLVAAVIASAASVPVHEAEAGTYTMKQCEGAQFLEFQAPYMNINGGRNVDVVRGCDIASVGKVGIYQDRSGPSMSYGNGGQFLWEAPDGVTVIGTEFTSRLKNANGIKAQLLGWNGNSFTYLDGGFTHDGSNQVSAWRDPSNPQPMVVVRLLCQDTNKCENKNTSAKAFLEVSDVEFTAQDLIPPQVAASGELLGWADGGFHRGWATVRVDASDRGSGIASTWLEVNGLRVDFSPSFCPGVRGSHTTRFTPCPTSHGTNMSVDTTKAPFREGSNSVRVCAVDYADAPAQANRTCSASRTIQIDNQPPDRPQLLRSREGEDWQAVNAFHLDWEIPEGQVSPVNGAWYVVTELGTDAFVESVNVEGEALKSLGPINVPDVGAYRVRVYLTDAAGNLGQPSEVILRFDDRPPGNVDPEPAAGWVSRDELPVQQEIEQAKAGGPSGIEGYALMVSPSGPSQPCESLICLTPEITLTGGADDRTGSIGGLAEGDHWVSAAAVSGAGRRSVEVGSTVVQVDKTTPTSTVSGVPGGWSNRPVTLTVMATDELSGMEAVAGDDGQPQTAIQVGSQTPYEASGSAATFTVATEGSNRVRYWAEDLAGNVNDGLVGSEGERHPPPGQAIVNIDLTPPTVNIDGLGDPSDPELVRASAKDLDSGVESVVISIRKAGSGSTYSPLHTTVEGNGYVARIPSDDLASGTYEVRAIAKDRAGNQGSENSDSKVSTALVNLPLKSVTTLSASMRGGKRAVRAGYSKAQYVEGRLISEGRPVSNRQIELTETFASGSRQVKLVSSVETDGDGRYSLALAKGPSRTVTASYAGSPTFTRATAPSLRLDVKGRIKFKVKPGKVLNGGVVKMKGKVGFNGALPPARGKLVAIQYLDPSRRKWRPVEVLRTNRRGVFRYTYRFRTISSAQKIIFRASALPEAGWPYLPSTSGSKSVIVYPKGRTRR